MGLASGAIGKPGSDKGEDNSHSCKDMDEEKYAEEVLTPVKKVASTCPSPQSLPHPSLPTPPSPQWACPEHC